MQEPIYERQKGETVKQFEAFITYRDMGLTRSLREVATVLNKSLALIGRWSSANNWVERVHEYDKEMDRKAILENIKKRRDMVSRHAKTSMMFQQKIIQRMNSLQAHELSPGDLVRWLEIAVKIERLSLGESTEIHENSLQHTGKNGGPIETVNKQETDLSNLTDEELKSLESIINKTTED